MMLLAQSFWHGGYCFTFYFWGKKTLSLSSKRFHSVSPIAPHFQFNLLVLPAFSWSPLASVPLLLRGSLLHCLQQGPHDSHPHHAPLLYSARPQQLHNSLQTGLGMCGLGRVCTCDIIAQWWWGSHPVKERGLYTVKERGSYTDKERGSYTDKERVGLGLGLVSV